MDKILIMQLNDIWWFCPFMIILFFAVKQFIDSIFMIHVKPNSVDRQYLLDCIKAGDAQDAGKLLNSRDTLVSSVAPLIVSGLEGKSSDYSCLKRKLKANIYGLLKMRLPHKDILNYYSVAIMLIGYLGNILSNFVMFTNFGVNSDSTSFLEHFACMAVGLRACFFGVIGAIILPLVNICLGNLLKKRKHIIEKFYNAMVSVIENRSSKEGLINEKL